MFTQRVVETSIHSVNITIIIDYLFCRMPSVSLYDTISCDPHHGDINYDEDFFFVALFKIKVQEKENGKNSIF